jgi:hypothetical protein
MGAESADFFFDCWHLKVITDDRKSVLYGRKVEDKFFPELLVTAAIVRRAHLFDPCEVTEHFNSDYNNSCPGLPHPSLVA